MRSLITPLLLKYEWARLQEGAVIQKPFPLSRDQVDDWQQITIDEAFERLRRMCKAGEEG